MCETLEDPSVGVVEVFNVTLFHLCHRRFSKESASDSYYHFKCKEHTLSAPPDHDCSQNDALSISWGIRIGSFLAEWSKVS